MNLPPVVHEQAPASVTAPEAAVSKFDQAPIAAERAPASKQAGPTFSVPMPAPGLLGAQINGVNSTSQGVVQIAQDDGDLIEKEWVNKAKAIVERNRDDPYKQTEEITVFKADYLKKRYDKTIKVSK